MIEQGVYPRVTNKIVADLERGLKSAHFTDKVRERVSVRATFEDR
jgi:hypothetical protein